MPLELYEPTLVKLLQKGNVKAFDSLFEVYSQKLYGFGMKYFKSETDSEELVQEVFVKVWENRKMLKTEYSFKSYLFTIAMNQIRKHFNKMKVALSYIESIKNENEFIDQSVPDNYEYMIKQIYQIIDQMPKRRREIFKKSKIEGKSSKEVAKELNISPGTVDNQVSEALRFIRSKLKSKNLGLLFFVFLFVS